MQVNPTAEARTPFLRTARLLIAFGATSMAVAARAQAPVRLVRQPELKATQAATDSLKALAKQLRDVATKVENAGLTTASGTKNLTAAAEAVQKALDAVRPARHVTWNGCGDQTGYNLLHAGSIAFLGDGGATATAEVVNLCAGDPDGTAFPITVTSATHALAKGSASPAKANALQILDINSGSVGLLVAPSVSYGSVTAWTIGALAGVRQNGLAGDSAKGIPDRTLNVFDYGAFVRVQLPVWQGDAKTATKGFGWVQATFSGMSTDAAGLRAAGLAASDGHELGVSSELGIDLKDVISVQLVYLSPLSDGLKGAVTGSAFKVKFELKQNPKP